MKFKYFWSLPYGSLYNLIEDNNKQPVKIYFFTVRTDPANVKVVAPSECIIYFNSDERVRFKHEGSKKENSIMKPHSYYFETKADADLRFQECVVALKKHLELIKNEIDHSLHALDKY